MEGLLEFAAPSIRQSANGGEMTLAPDTVDERAASRHAIPAMMALDPARKRR
jgi:hypothetical protein